MFGKNRLINTFVQVWFWSCKFINRFSSLQQIIAVVVEGRSGAGNRGGRDRYRKLDNNSEDPEARIKNSNEVYVY